MGCLVLNRLQPVEAAGHAHHLLRHRRMHLVEHLRMEVAQVALELVVALAAARTHHPSSHATVLSLVLHLGLQGLPARLRL